MTREQFLSRRTPPKTFPSKIDGQSVSVRKLSVDDVETLQRDYLKKGKEVDATLFVVCRAAVKDDGSRVFSDEDMKALADIDFDAVQEIAEAATAFSGLKGKSAAAE